MGRGTQVCGQLPRNSPRAGSGQGVALCGMCRMCSCCLTACRAERNLPDLRRLGELHRHRPPFRHTHPLAAGRERRHRRTHADRHGGEFRHRDGWCADAVHCRATEWQFRLGAPGRRVSGAVFEQEIIADLPATTQFLSPRFYMNNEATAASVGYDCSGVYVETDY